MFVSAKKFKGLEEEVSALRAAVLNLQNLTRILERDICNCRDITAIGGNRNGRKENKHVRRR